MAQNMHFDVTGDCSSAIAALSNTESAVDRVAGMDASVGVQVRGAPSAVSQLESVGKAAQAASADVNVGADTRGLAGAQRSVSALRAEIGGMSREIGGVGDLNVGVSGGGGIREMSGAVRGLGNAFETAAGGMESYATSGGRASSASSEMGREMSASTRATEGHTAALQDHRAELQGHRSDVQGLTADTRELQSISAGSSGAFGGGGGIGRDMSSLRTPGGGSGFGFQSPGSGTLPPAMGFHAPSGTYYNATANPGGPGPPPSSGGRGGGGGGGGGRGGSPWSSEGDGGGGGALPLTAGVYAGAIEEMVAGGAGLIGVTETIKQVPILALSATMAMNKLDQGIRSTGMAAAATGVGGLVALGQALRPLGAELGTIGVQNMATALASAKALAQDATVSLKGLEPAIGPAIGGLTSLGGALMEGVSSPQAVNGAKELGQTLQDPQNAQGIANLTSGVMMLGTGASQVLSDVAGVIGNIPGMSGNETGTEMGTGVGFLAGGMKGLAGRGGTAILGGVLGHEIQQDQKEGVDPTDAVTSLIGGASLGKTGLGLLGKAGKLGEGAELAGKLGKFGGPAMVAGGIAAYGAEKLLGGDSPTASGAISGAVDAASMVGMFTAPFGPEVAVPAMALAALGGGIYGALNAAPSQKTASAADPKVLQGKAADDAKASAADPTNLALAQQAEFSKAIADSRAPGGANGPAGPGTSAFYDGGVGGGSSGPIGGGPGGMPGTPYDSGQPVVSGVMGGGDWTVGGTNVVPPGGPTITTYGMPQTNKDGAWEQNPHLMPGTEGTLLQPGATPPKSNDAFGPGGPFAGLAPSASAHPGPSSTGGSSQGGGPSWPHPGGGNAGGPASDAQSRKMDSLNASASAPLSASSASPGGTSPFAPSAAPNIPVVGPRPSTPGGGQPWAPGSGPIGGGPGGVPGSPYDSGQPVVSGVMGGGDWTVGGLNVLPPGGPTITTYGMPLTDEKGAWVQDPAQLPGADRTAGSLLNPGGQLERQKPSPFAAGGPFDGLAPPPTGRPVTPPRSAPPGSIGGVAHPHLGGGMAGGPATALEAQKLSRAFDGTSSSATQFQQRNSSLAQSLTQVSQGATTSGTGVQQAEQHNNQLTPSLQQVAKGSNDAARASDKLGQSLDASSQAATAAGSSAPAAAGAMAGLGSAAGGAAAAASSGMASVAKSVGEGAVAAGGGGQDAGNALADGFGQAMANSAPTATAQAAKLAGGAGMAAAKALKAKSPSQVFVALGEGTGQGLAIGIGKSMGLASAAASNGANVVSSGAASALTGGIFDVLDGARGVASDAGLAVGFAYVDSMATGVRSVIKSSDFLQLGFPDIKSARAKAELGALGLMGPAGSGAQSYQLAAREVGFGAGTPAVQPPQPITVNVSLDGKPFDQKIVTANTQLLDALTNSLSKQRSR